MLNSQNSSIVTIGTGMGMFRKDPAECLSQQTAPPELCSATWRSEAGVTPGPSVTTAFNC